MATEVGTGYVTIYSKVSPDFDKPIKSQVKASGTSAGTSFGGTFSVAAGNLLSSGISKALSAVTSHMNSAIGRVDALNQFPKVMSNIGFSSDEASAAIKKMSDGIQGLPTTLDDIVGNTQRLAMSMGDLGKASDVAIALNDGFLMFGASSADVGNAITQLNQMITAGKYDMQSWNSINQAAPGFLDTVARSMLGAEANAGQLRDALNDGSVSTEDFLNSIVTLDQVGGDGITSFSEGVKSATGGIETSLSRIDSAITRNIANVLDLVNQNVDFVSICNVVVEAINQVGTFINDTLISAFTAAQPLVEQLTSGITELGENLNPFLNDAINVIGTVIQGTLIVVVTAAIAIFNALIGIINTVIGFFKNLGSTVSSIAETVRGAFSAMWSGIITFVGNVASAVSSIASTIIGTISSLPGQALQWGADIVNNIANGIRNAIGAVTGAVSDVASTISSFLHFSEPDVGPLSNFHTFMPDMMKLMADGIHKNMRLVRKEVDGVADFMAGGLGGVSVSAVGSGANSYNFNGITINAQDRSMDEVFDELVAYANRSRIMMGVR